MNLWKMTALASLVISVGAMAASETTTVVQSGNGNNAVTKQGLLLQPATNSTTSIYQINGANANDAYTTQLATNSSISVTQQAGHDNAVGSAASPFTQTGGHNSTAIVQTGNFNQVTAPSASVQGGNYNTLEIYQTGNHNNVTPTQNSGAFNSTLITQTGNNDQATTAQYGSLNTTIVTQSAVGGLYGASGNDNKATTSQVGVSNYVNVSQSGSSSGNGNPDGGVSVTQVGLANSATTKQDDWGGETDVQQYGGFNTASVVQNSPSDAANGYSHADLIQSGLANNATITQNYGVVNGSVAANASVSQLGSFNTASVTQN